MHSSTHRYLIDSLRKTFSTGTTIPLKWRYEQLHGIRNLVDDHAEDIIDALKQDLGKPALEAKYSEIEYVKTEVKHALKKLPKWTNSQRLRIPFILRPASASVRQEPYGVALIIGPWNFPFQLLITPLISALAAGNCALLKPSEIAPSTSTLLANLLPEYLDKNAVSVVEGDAETAKSLLSETFDYIFYTGNSNIGRQILSAAAQNLTPATLELGGKCPCIVDGSANLKVAARRIVWGKFLNAGQTCVAPDYVLVKNSCEEELLHYMAEAVKSFYGREPATSRDYGRIVNSKHFDRLTGLLTAGTTVTGGLYDRSQLYISPTILRDVSTETAIMQEEIFGPILPVLRMDNLASAADFIRKKPKPLALYMFSSSRQNHKFILQNTSSGGVCINDTILQLITPRLPFGGVGESGMGRYHGKAGFDTFSNPKTILKRKTWPDPEFRYPPYPEL
ncbi:MAG: aldehyde dehydrogenase family protein [Lentisphaeria bacterium]